MQVASSTLAAKDPATRAAVSSNGQTRLLMTTQLRPRIGEEVETTTPTTSGEEGAEAREATTSTTPEEHFEGEGAEQEQLEMQDGSVEAAESQVSKFAYH